jgi:DNA modification methylase
MNPLVQTELEAPPEVTDADERSDALPQEEEFWRLPTRFGSVPVEKEPLGWDRRKGFRKLFPAVYLPFQVVERVAFGHPDLEPNRLFWGDNLHVMRQLPSESIDLIYIDPPFFSGRQYNVIFGDQNELRSFSDIWEGGMPGYLIWLNARLYEMKRLLKKMGSIYVHCDWHASHYVKVEMDKIFGHESFRNEVTWNYLVDKGNFSNKYPPRHDAILFYAKGRDNYFDKESIRMEPSEATLKRWGKYADETGAVPFEKLTPGMRKVASKDEKPYLLRGGPQVDWITGIPGLNSGASREVIDYPTQKPEKLLELFLKASSKPGDLIADFFCGGGTTAAVAQRLGRHWIACDQSRVAVAITADRLTPQVDEQTGRMFPVPDFTVEHWGVH